MITSQCFRFSCFNGKAKTNKVLLTLDERIIALNMLSFTSFIDCLADFESVQYLCFYSVTLSHCHRSELNIERNETLSTINAIMVVTFIPLSELQ
jgi:hypothetical protein